MRVVRWLLGRLILMFDALTSQRGITRPVEQQSSLDQQTQQLSLYQYHACPFCVKVRRFNKRHTLNIETLNAKDPVFADELEKQGGQLKVPCLKIKQADGKVQWLYESGEIIRYLEEQFLQPLESAEIKPCEADT